MSRPNSALFLSAILSRHSDEHRHVWRAGRSEQSYRLRAARVYDEAGNVIETHEHAGEFKEW
jgi:hypothetical protein